jgi:hypothetical protein
VTLLSFSPREGAPGTEVTFIGSGFGAQLTDNTVSFNGTVAEVISANSSRIVARVPAGATTGLATINTPNGMVTTVEPFKVLASLSIKPSNITLQPAEVQQFRAIFSPAGGNESINWSVNGIAGGDTSVGKITPEGFYTAPNLATTQTSLNVTLRATSVATATLFAETSITIRFSTEVKPWTAVSVRNGASNVGYAIVSVRNGGLPIPIRAASLSVRNGPVSAPGLRAAVSVTSGPHITSITPTNLSRGGSVSLTINGVNLDGATMLRFINDDGSLDSTISASNISVNAEGTVLSVTVNVTSSSPLGGRNVMVVSANGHSLTGNGGTNRIQIVTP